MGTSSAATCVRREKERWFFERFWGWVVVAQESCLQVGEHGFETILKRKCDVLAQAECAVWSAAHPVFAGTARGTADTQVVELQYTMDAGPLLLECVAFI